MGSALLGLTLLMIGDSHFVTETFLIKTLPESLALEGAKTVTYGACGVPSGVWVTPRAIPCGIGERIGTGPVQVNRDPKALNPSLSSLVAKVHPDVLVIVAGDTMAAYGSKTMPKDWILSNVGALVAEVKAANLPCIWVGPPWGTEGGPLIKTFVRVRELADVIQSASAPCRFVDSTTFAKPGEWRTFDGVHYTPDSYQKWSAEITRVIIDDSRVRMLVKKRTGSCAAPVWPGLWHRC
jgi:hypothetical protein